MDAGSKMLNSYEWKENISTNVCVNFSRGINFIFKIRCSMVSSCTYSTCLTQHIPTIMNNVRILGFNANQTYFRFEEELNILY